MVATWLSLMTVQQDWDVILESDLWKLKFGMVSHLLWVRRV